MSSDLLSVTTTGPSVGPVGVGPGQARGAGANADLFQQVMAEKTSADRPGGAPEANADADDTDPPSSDEPTDPPAPARPSKGARVLPFERKTPAARAGTAATGEPDDQTGFVTLTVSVLIPGQPITGDASNSGDTSEEPDPSAPKRQASTDDEAQVVTLDAGIAPPPAQPDTRVVIDVPVLPEVEAPAVPSPVTNTEGGDPARGPAVRASQSGTGNSAPAGSSQDATPASTGDATLTVVPVLSGITLPVTAAATEASASTDVRGSAPSTAGQNVPQNAPSVLAAGLATGAGPVPAQSTIVEPHVTAADAARDAALLSGDVRPATPSLLNSQGVSAASTIEEIVASMASQSPASAAANLATAALYRFVAAHAEGATADASESSAASETDTGASASRATLLASATRTPAVPPFALPASRLTEFARATSAAESLRQIPAAPLLPGREPAPVASRAADASLRRDAGGDPLFLTSMQASGAPASAWSTVASEAQAVRIPNEEHLASSIVQAMKLQGTSGGGRAVVTLSPDYLGDVTIDVRVAQGAVVATVHAANADVRAWLEGHESTLRQGLAVQGLTLERLVVLDESTTEEPSEESERKRQQQPDQDAPRAPRRASTGTFNVVV